MPSYDAAGNTKVVYGTTSQPPEIPATPLVATATAAAAGAAAVTLAAPGAGKANYITGIQFTSSASTAVVTGICTATNINSGGATTLNWQFVENTTQGGQLLLSFYPPLQGVTNTAQVITLPAIATGGIPVVTVQGFTQ